MRFKWRWNSKTLTQTIRKYQRVWGGEAVPLRKIGQYIAEVSKQSFKTKADPATGHSWPSLNRDYASYKASKGRTAGALIFYGHLMRSIGYSITIPRVIIGPAAAHGIFHQFGARGVGLGRSGGSAQTLPARPFLGVGPTDEAWIKREVAKYIVGGKG